MHPLELLTAVLKICKLFSASRSSGVEQDALEVGLSMGRLRDETRADDTL